MSKSGLIFGGISFVLILVSSIIISPVCAPCLGLFLGLAAGYMAGVFDKPSIAGEATRKGAIAGAISGGIGFLGGLIGAVINGLILNPASMEQILKTVGLTNVVVNKSSIWIGQLVGGICIGLFDIALMALLGAAGGAVWFQRVGKNRPDGMIQPPELPLTGA